MAEQEQAEQKQEAPQASQTFVRDEDFEALYANNVIAETSVWDMKVIFGILDQSSEPNKIVQHTSVNLPWAQVKLLSYYIRINVLIQESINGKIHLPSSVIPPDPGKLDLSLLPAETREGLAQLYRDFIATV